jgi:hypothetical protein
MYVFDLLNKTVKFLYSQVSHCQRFVFLDPACSCKASKYKHCIEANLVKFWGQNYQHLFFSLQWLYLTQQIQWYNDKVIHFIVGLVFGFVESRFYYHKHSPALTKLRQRYEPDSVLNQVSSLQQQNEPFLIE